jgi:hypothetical protein
MTKAPFGLKPTEELKVFDEFTTKCAMGVRSSSRDWQRRRKLKVLENPID